MLRKMWGVLGPFRFDNPFPLIWSCYLMKPSHCLVDVTGLRYSTYLWCNSFNVISVESYLNQSWSSFKPCANLIVGNNLSNPRLWKIELRIARLIKSNKQSLVEKLNWRIFKGQCRSQGRYWDNIKHLWLSFSVKMLTAIKTVNCFRKKAPSYIL